LSITYLGICAEGLGVFPLILRDMTHWTELACISEPDIDNADRSLSDSLPLAITQ